MTFHEASLTAAVIEVDIERFKEAVRPNFVGMGGSKSRGEIRGCVGTEWEGRVRGIEVSVGEFVGEAKEARTKGSYKITSRIDV